MIRNLGIRSKLLLVLLGVSLVVVMAMALSTRWAFERGFLVYLGGAEVERVQPIAEALQAAYADHGSWDFLRENPRAWPTILSAFEQHHGARASITDTPPPVPGEEGTRGVGRFGGFQIKPPGASEETLRLAERIRVLDLSGTLVHGEALDGSEHRRELLVQGKPVGWLAVSAPPWLENDLSRQFTEHQQSALLLSMGGTLLLALLIGIFVADRILQPIQRLALGARSLAGGALETRVPETSRDELGRLSADFNRLAETLERNETLRRQGMADASHELRTPLAVLHAEIEALLDGVRPCDQQRLQQLHGRATRLGRLVDDLFELARADAGALDYEMTEIQLDRIVTDCAEAMETEFASAELSLKVEMEDDLRLSGDPDRLRQVINNLLKNSLRYTDAPGEVLLAAQEQGDQLVITLQDSAPAVGREHLEHLFDRFYRADASRSRSSGGTGLGLAICRNIIEAHSGVINAQVSPLGGLSIAIRLPRQH